MRRTRWVGVGVTMLAAVMLSSCGGVQSNSGSDNGRPSGTQLQQSSQSKNQSSSGQAGRPARDPTPGEWPDTYSSPADLDGELDEAWLDCAPHNNPDPTSFTWKRASDHGAVWLHAETSGSLGKQQASCMDDELDIHSASAPGSSWRVESFGDYERYQRKADGSFDVVWKYADRVRDSLTVKADSYQVRLPYSWLGEFTAQVNGDDVAILSREHPDYALCSFALVDPSMPVNGGDISSSLITQVGVGAGNVVMWAKRWAFMAAMDPTTVDADAAEDVTDLQTGDGVDHDTLLAQVSGGDYSGLFKIDDYLKARVSIEEKG